VLPTTDRQTTDDRRQTDERQHIANVNVSSRSLKIPGSDCKYFEVPARPIKIMYTTISVERRSLVQLLLCIVDTFDYRLLLLIHYVTSFVHCF